MVDLTKNKNKDQRMEIVRIFNDVKNKTSDKNMNWNCVLCDAGELSLITYSENM